MLNALGPGRLSRILYTYIIYLIYTLGTDKSASLIPFPAPPARTVP